MQHLKEREIIDKLQRHMRSQPRYGVVPRTQTLSLRGKYRQKEGTLWWTSPKLNEF